MGPRDGSLNRIGVIYSRVTYCSCRELTILDFADEKRDIWCSTTKGVMHGSDAGTEFGRLDGHLPALRVVKYHFIAEPASIIISII